MINLNAIQYSNFSNLNNNNSNNSNNNFKRLNNSFTQFCYIIIQSFNSLISRKYGPSSCQCEIEVKIAVLILLKVQTKYIQNIQGGE